MRRILLVVAFSVSAFLLVLVVIIRLRYGGGRGYPDLTTTPLVGESQLEQVVSFPEPIGNVAVSSDGRLFFTVHPEARPEGPKLYEWVNGAAVAYPDESSQDALFDTPLGIVVDRQRRLWTIDHGGHGFGSVRLLAFDLDSSDVVHDHVFHRSVAPRGSFLQDLQVDPSGETIYIADVSFWRGSPALVVYDVQSQRGRRTLQDHPSVVPQDYIIQTPFKRMVFFGGLAALKPGVDGIAIDAAGEWLYYGAMTHDGLYRIPARDLRGHSLGPSVLAQRVERFSVKPLSDGLSTDLEGNVYITDVEHGAVMRVGEGRPLETLILSPRVRWADALSFGPDGWLYLADSAIPEIMLRSREHIRQAGPYFVFRFRPGAEGVPGQ